jgi:fructosamine-3-kinase
VDPRGPAHVREQPALRRLGSGILSPGSSSLNRASPLIAAAISAATGAPFRIASSRAVSGGCIHASVALAGEDGRHYFAKTNDARQGANLAAEADGLAALAAAGMRVPTVIAQGVAEDTAFLVLEHLALREGRPAEYRELGRSLARMHARPVGTTFGWHRPNFIGATPQRNGETHDWAEFWDRERLGPQLALAAERGLGDALQSLGARLRAAVPRLLAGRAPKPALLHGDLWGGNAAFVQSGEPVVFDPAVYRGDPEADLAMTELFGGFPRAFYEGYGEIAPIDPGYARRRDLYNLYHVLNHANLFGGSYAAQAARMMSRLLDAAR